MSSRLFFATIGGVAASFAGWKMYAQQLEAQQAAALRDFRQSPSFRRFAKFASITAAGGEADPVMTMQDFVTSLTTSPSSSSSSSNGGKPKGHHDAAAALVFQDATVKKLIDELLALIDSDKSGTIDFTEFLTLQTLLAVPHQELRGALELFDKSAKERVTLPQFRALLRAMSAGRVGSENSAVTDANSSLARYFFGPSGTQTVTFDEFVGRLADIRGLVRKVEFQCAVRTEQTRNGTASAASSSSSGTMATLRSVRARLVGTPPGMPLERDVSNEASASANSTLLPFKDDAAIVGEADYAVFMALLGVSSEWTPGLDLYLRQEGNKIDHAMLSRVLEDVDISALVPANSRTCSDAGAIVGQVKAQQQQPIATTATTSSSSWWSSLASSPIPEPKKRSVSAATPVHPSARHASMFCQLMDENGDGTIDVSEVEKVAKAHSSFFSTYVPSFREAPRNVVQQWVFCMQQRE